MILIARHYARRGRTAPLVRGPDQGADEPDPGRRPCPGDRPAFTHILKPTGGAGFDMLPIVEWLCLELGRAAGFETPDAALIAMPDGMPPTLVVERFDIRRGPHDQRRLAMEDFCSILDLPTLAKYDGTIERMARALRPLSTDPTADWAGARFSETSLSATF